MSKQKLVTLQIELYEDYDELTTVSPIVQYYTRIHWSGTDASMVSPLFKHPFDAFRWAGDMMC